VLLEKHKYIDFDPSSPEYQVNCAIYVFIPFSVYVIKEIVLCMKQHE